MVFSALIYHLCSPVPVPGDELKKTLRDAKTDPKRTLIARSVAKIREQKNGCLLVNHAFARVTPAIFVIFRRFHGVLVSKSSCFTG